MFSNIESGWLCLQSYACFVGHHGKPEPQPLDGCRYDSFAKEGAAAAGVWFHVFWELRKRTLTFAVNQGARRRGVRHAFNRVESMFDWGGRIYDFVECQGFSFILARPGDFGLCSCLILIGWVVEVPHRVTWAQFKASKLPAAKAMSNTERLAYFFSTVFELNQTEDIKKATYKDQLLLF